MRSGSDQPRSNTSTAPPAYQNGEQRRPWRVVPLMIGAVIGTVAASAGASELLREASGERYALQIIKDAL